MSLLYFFVQSLDQYKSGMHSVLGVNTEFIWTVVFFLLDAPLRILPAEDCEQKWELIFTVCSFSFCLTLHC